MKRTLAYFTDSPGFGGAEKYLLQIFAHLDSGFWNPVLFYHPSEGIEPLVRSARDLGVEVRAVPPLPLGIAGARQVPAFARLVEEIRPDIFHANLTWPLSGKYGLAAAIKTRLPAVLATVHSFPQVNYSLSTRFQLRVLASWTDGYIAVSRSLGRRFQQAFWIPPRKIRVIYNGLPAEAFHLQSAWEVEVVDPRQAVVFTASRLVQQKGLEFLVEAAARVPGVLFVLAGEGPQRAILEARVSELGLGDRFLLTGFLEDVSSWLARADLIVLPSLFEGFPFSILEAMAARKPVVATNIEGIDEAVVHGETGLLVTPADAHALAQAIQSLLADPQRAAAMGTAGRDRAQRLFNLDRMIDSLFELYDQALSGRESAPV